MATVRVEDALPPAGTMTELGSPKVTPVGATPYQDAENVTVELSPLSDERVTVAASDVLGARYIATGAGWTVELIAKSGIITGARMEGVLAMVTTISDEWETSPFVAVSTSV